MPKPVFERGELQALILRLRRGGGGMSAQVPTIPTGWNAGGPAGLLPNR